MMLLPQEVLMPEKRDVLRLMLLGALLLVPILACNMPAETGTGGPAVTIVAPLDGSTVVVGQQVLIQSTASDSRGISRVELIVNAVPVRADPPIEEITTLFAIAQPWFPDTPGDVVVQVIAYNIDNQASLPASITLHVVESAGGATPVPLPTSTPVPDVTAESGCTLNASFAADVTIPDQSELQPGVSFVKTWRIRNSGTCDWETGFHLVFVGGDQLGAPASVSAPATVSGATADVSVPMTGPLGPGSYRGNWRMQSADSQVFGSTVWVIIVVPSPVTSTPAPTSTPVPTQTPLPTATASPPAAPTNLMMSTSTSGYVSLVWTDNASDEQGFHILADGAILHTVVGANNTGWGFMYSDYADVWCGKTVSLTVVAYKGDKWSAPSNAVQYVGPPCPPPVVAQGSATMMLGNGLDLDTGTVGALSGDSDLMWQKPGGTLLLRAVNGMSFGVMGVVGPSIPSYATCDAMAKISYGGIPVPDLQVGTLLCYNTTGGNLAGIRVDEIQADEDIVLSFVTWEGP
jgi:hypothetical protein